jgi:hypothetical protein
MLRPRPVLAQGCLDQAAPYGSAYWGAPAAHTRAVEVIGAAESDPKRSFAPCVGVQELGITRYGFRRFDRTHGEYCAPGTRTPKTRPRRVKLMTKRGASMVEADAVLAQEVALSGTLACGWRWSHMRKQPNGTPSKSLRAIGQDPAGPEASTDRRC